MRFPATKIAIATTVGFILSSLIMAASIADTLDQTFVLKNHFFEGVGETYGLRATMSQTVVDKNGRDFSSKSIAMNIVRRIKSVDKLTGNAVVDVATAVTGITSDGEPIQTANWDDTTMTTHVVLDLSPNGKIVAKMPISAADGMKTPTSTANQLVPVEFLPDHPVHIGDSWQGRTPLNGLFPMMVFYKMTLTGVDYMDGHLIAHIRTKQFAVTNKAAQPGYVSRLSGTMTETGQTDFDIDSGVTKSSYVSENMTLFTPQKGKRTQIKTHLALLIQMNEISSWTPSAPTGQ